MRNNFILFAVCLALGLSPCYADNQHYRTAPPQNPDHPTSEIDIPLLEIDPDTGERRIYLRPTPQGETHIAQAFYQSEPGAGDPHLHQAILQLHQQMNTACPAGWLKLEEWAAVSERGIQLHYRFACLGQSR